MVMRFIADAALTDVAAAWARDYRLLAPVREGASIVYRPWAKDMHVAVTGQCRQCDGRCLRAGVVREDGVVQVGGHRHDCGESGDKRVDG